MDRFAYAWMWDRGGWDITPHNENGPGSSGEKEPLVPRPSPSGIHLRGPHRGH